MTVRGVDFSFSRPPVSLLRAEQVAFVGRYVSVPHDQKNLTHDEAAIYIANGIAIVTLFETVANRAMSGYAAGFADAMSGRMQATDCGQPDSAPIYFTVDFPVTAAQMNTVKDYFRGINDAERGRPVGVYGDVFVCTELYSDGLVEYAWQTSAWSRGEWSDADDIRQITNGVSWNGFTVDINDAMTEDFGQWGVNTPAPTPAPTQDWELTMLQRLPVVQIGDKDQPNSTWFVRRVQAILRDVVGCNIGPSGVDGDFGPATEAAVKVFQQQRGVTVDGIVGQHTWACLVTGSDL